MVILLFLYWVLQETSNPLSWYSCRQNSDAVLPPSHLSPILITKRYGLSCYCGLRPTPVAWESLNVGSNVFAFSIYPSGQEMSEHSTALIWDHRVKKKKNLKKIELLSSTWEERKVLRRKLQCASAFLITQASHVCWLLHPVCAHRRKKPLGVVESFLFPLLFPSQNVEQLSDACA